VRCIIERVLPQQLPCGLHTDECTGAPQGDTTGRCGSPHAQQTSIQLQPTTRHLPTIQTADTHELYFSYTLAAHVARHAAALTDSRAELHGKTRPGLPRCLPSSCQSPCTKAY
jgi:hypothetical protein